MNGSYNWALEHGLSPSAQIIVDARAFNARFTKPVIEGCKYLLASQCHPSVFEGLPQDRTYLWHTGFNNIQEVVKEFYDVMWPVPSASTVLLTGILLLRMLGFRRFHLFGCDSCLMDTHNLNCPALFTKGAAACICGPSAGFNHHAYAQPENDSENHVPVTVTDGRVFWCHPWMVGQAQSFLDLIKCFGDEIEIEVYGDGLLSHILTTGASLEKE
jgi:hypothetical protein